MKKQVDGTCHICGQFKRLSYEHLPPKSAGNKNTVKFYTFDDFITSYSHSNDNSHTSKPHIIQGGFQVPTICEDCNNKTGAYYVKAYSEFAKIVYCSLKENDCSNFLNHLINFECSLRPLNFFKQVITMFCSILERPAIQSYGLDKFVLDKNTNTLDGEPFSLHMYIVPNDSSITMSPACYGIYNTDLHKYAMLAEFIAPPFGFVLNLTPSLAKLNLLDLSPLNDFKYNEVVKLKFELPFLKPTGFYLNYEGINQDKILIWE